MAYALAGERPMQLHTLAALDPAEQKIYADLRNALPTRTCARPLRRNRSNTSWTSGIRKFTAGTTPIRG